jgi:hypothetical protein
MQARCGRRTGRGSLDQASQWPNSAVASTTSILDGTHYRWRRTQSRDLMVPAGRVLAATGLWPRRPNSAEKANR